MLLADEPTRRLDDVVDVVEARRRLIEATREASRWGTPKRRIAKAVTQ